MRSLAALVVVAVGSLAMGCATEGAGPNEIKPRANLTAADFYPLAPGWKWAYDVEKDGINILATYAVVERTGDTAVVQTGDEKLTYAVTPDGIVQKDGGMLGDYVIKNPVKAGAEWAGRGRAGAPRLGDAPTSSSTPVSTTSAASSSRSRAPIRCASRARPSRPISGRSCWSCRCRTAAKFTTITRARLRAVTRPGDSLSRDPERVPRPPR